MCSPRSAPLQVGHAHKQHDVWKVCNISIQGKLTLNEGTGDTLLFSLKEQCTSHRVTSNDTQRGWRTLINRRVSVTFYITLGQPSHANTELREKTPHSWRCKVLPYWIYIGILYIVNLTSSITPWIKQIHPQGKALYSYGRHYPCMLNSPGSATLTNSSYCFIQQVLKHLNSKSLWQRPLKQRLITYQCDLQCLKGKSAILTTESRSLTLT